MFDILSFYLSHHKTEYKTIAKSLGCSPMKVYRFAHSKPIKPRNQLEERIKEKLIEFGIIHHRHER